MPRRTTSPIVLEWDEDGLHIRVDLDEIRYCTIEMDEGELRGVLNTANAFDLYEHMEEVLGEWAREGMAQRANVRAGLDHNGRPRVVQDDSIPYSNLEAIDRDELAELYRERADLDRKRAKGE